MLVLALVGFSLAQFGSDEMKQLESISNLLCNFEVKKIIVKAETALNELKHQHGENKEKLEEVVKKVIGMAMRGCLDNLKDPSHIENLMKGDGDDIANKQLPFAKNIDVAEIIKSNNYKLTVNEEEFYQRYMESEEDVKKMESENQEGRDL